MCNDSFALHNTPEAKDSMNMTTRGLYHSVTRSVPRPAHSARRPDNTKAP
jgi:hypothetical protein